ncbi:VanZ family protein [Tumebacillus flagellatus]|uniref:VanZ family protein n=1 Tax=Tumebacillus flagellatus TaxID=1157490 RepID=UPI0012690ADC|nr:VanZ family protein [Tumebacillus flagellatus]
MIRIDFPTFLLPVLALWLYWRRNKFREAGRELWMNLFFLYGLAVTYVTFFPLTIRVSAARHVNMIPFVEMKWLLYRPLVAVLNLGGNVVMFAPLGFFLPILWARVRGFWKTAGIGMLLSLSIEFLQYLTADREADIDDVMLNTTGAILGYWLYLLWNSIQKKAEA